jgi:hypothetical protein
VHSIYKANSQVVDVGEKHVMVSGNLWGVTYNDAGSGPLHVGAWFCTYAFENVSSPAQNGGACAFGDAGGADKIYIVWSGTNIANVDQGTGKRLWRYLRFQPLVARRAVPAGFGRRGVAAASPCLAGNPAVGRR